MVSIGATASNNPVIQRVYTSTAALIVVGAAIPLDDTIPQSGEGQEIFSLAITPKKSTNILEMIFTCNAMGQGANANLLIALFQDAGANAFAATRIIGVTNEAGGAAGVLRHTMAAGTTSSTTFKVRAGYHVATVDINGNSGLREFGGVSATEFTIIEYQV